MKKILLTIAIILGLGFGNKAHAVVFPVQATSFYPGASPQSKAFTSIVTNGDLIVVCYQGGNSSSLHIGTPVVSDSIGNTFTLATTSQSTKIAHYIYYAFSTSTQIDTITVVKGTNDNDPGFHMMEFSGVSSSNTIVASSTGSGSSATYAAADMVINSAPGVIYACSGQETSTGVFTAGAGYTLGTQQSTHVSADEYQVYSSTGTYPVTITNALNTAYDTLGVAFLAAPPISRLIFWAQTFINGQIFIN